MLTVVYVLLALQLFVVASPVDQDNKGTRISLARRQDHIPEDGIANIEALVLSVLNALAKYEGTISAYQRNTEKKAPISFGAGIPISDLSNATYNKRATGNELLTDDSNSLWQGIIQVGTPPVSYTVDFDTGSSDLFLPGPTCTSDNCKGHTHYNPAASSTSANRHRSFTVSYGDGSSVSGSQYSDTVTVAALTAKGQALGAATTYSSGLSQTNFPPDGLLGMGYQSISQYNSPPFFQTIVAQGVATQPVFAFKLAQSGSELYLGGVNSKLFTGTFTYAPVTTQAYWQINMDSVFVNSATAPALGKLSVIIDTGTTLVIGDKDNVQKLYSEIPGAKLAPDFGPGFYTFPCNSVPTIKLTFGGKSFPIAPSILNLGRVSANSASCVSGLVSSGTSMNFWILGDVFMRNVYTQFDLGNNRVGFATLK